METFTALVPVPADYDGEIPSYMDIRDAPMHPPIAVKRLTDARICDADGNTIYWLGDHGLDVFRYVWDVTP